MDWNAIEAKWSEYKGKAKQQWDKLSEEQIRNTRGKHDYVVRRVQEAYSLTRQEADREVADWQSKQVDIRPAANS